MSDLVRAGTQALEAYIAAGDIGRLNPDQRIALYRSVCSSLGLNELTQPFQYLTLSGKTVLYATKSCTEQLRQIHGVSVVEMTRERFDDILVVTVKVREKTSREDIATGAVSLKGLAGENLSNAYMKAETKAKRRATLSVCGLAVLDESETDSIAGAQTRTIEEIHGTAAPATKVEKEPRKAKPEPVIDVPVAALPAPTESILIMPDAQIEVVPNAAGRKVWRIDGEGIPTLAVIEPTIASMIEANAAFGVVTKATVEQRNGKRVVTSVEEARDV